MPKRGRVRYNPKVYRRRVEQPVHREQPTTSLGLGGRAADLDQAPIDLNDVDSSGIFEGILQKEMRFNEALEDVGISGATLKARQQISTEVGDASKTATNPIGEVIAAEDNQVSFVKANEKHLKIFSKFRKPENSCAFLLKYPHLACEETANYLVDTCVSLEIEKKRTIGSFVAHQCVCIQYILELAKQLGVASKEIIAFFFTRLQMPDSTYREAFEEELYLFKQRVVDHAKSKKVSYQHVETVTTKVSETPVVLDPEEVLKTLPEALKEGFQTQNIELLQDAIDKLPEEEAQYHMQRCIDSGLWVPGQSVANKSDDDEIPDGEKVSKEEKEKV